MCCGIKVNNKSLLSIQSYVKQKCTNEIYTLDESIADLDKSSKAMHIEFNNLLRMMTNE